MYNCGITPFVEKNNLKPISMIPVRYNNPLLGTAVVSPALSPPPPPLFVIRDRAGGGGGRAGLE